MTITYTEAALLLGVSGRTVSRLVSSGHLKPIPEIGDDGRPVLRLRRSQVENLAKKRSKA